MATGSVKVFVGSLPPGVQPHDVEALFSQFGTLVNSIVKCEQRYGFVFFSSIEEAQEAIAQLNGYVFEGSPIVVKLADKQAPQPGGGPPLVTVHAQSRAPSYGAQREAQPPPPPSGQDGRLYIKGLPAGMTDDAVLEIFQEYGQVVDTKVLVANGESNDGTGQSVAIVRMGSPAEAEWLVMNINNYIPTGLERPVEISYAGHGSTRAAAPAPAYAGPVPSARVVPGPVATARVVPYASRNPSAPAARKPPIPAGMVPAQLGPPLQPPPPAIVRYVEASAPLMPSGAAPGGAMAPAAQSMRAQCTPGCKLYVKGLPLHADDCYLYKVFSPFGRVLEAVALPKGSYVIGFVLYASDHEAQEAIANLHAVELTDGISLQVAVKTSK